jgi:hypothetical protein
MNLSIRYEEHCVRDLLRIVITNVVLGNTNRGPGRRGGTRRGRQASK